MTETAFEKIKRGMEEAIAWAEHWRQREQSKPEDRQILNNMQAQAKLTKWDLSR